MVQTPAKTAVSRGAEIADAATGLFTEAYLRAALPTRVAAARRGLRPLGVVLVVVDQDGDDQMAVSSAVRSTIRDSDTPCRLDDGSYALILEDTTLAGCAHAVERLRQLLDERVPEARTWAGIASYPVHAFGGEALLGQVKAALAAARHQHEAGGFEVAAVLAD